MEKLKFTMLFLKIKSKENSFPPHVNRQRALRSRSWSLVRPLARDPIPVVLSLRAAA